MSRTARIFLAIVTLTVICGGSSTQAAFFGLPRVLRLQLDTIRFEEPALAPIAYSRFCMQYPDDCQIHRAFFRPPRPQVLTALRLEDLVEVNRDVNRAIAPRAEVGGVLGERWRIAPEAGACNDYAVTKRHELLARGWPAWSLLLAEVVVPWGEHHLVLVVRTNSGDLVLDSLNGAIRPWSRTPYQWVRIQSVSNPNFWDTVASRRSGEASASSNPKGRSFEAPAAALGKGQTEDGTS
jgi:predicted transglutaminase-like cysteine proteinase